MCQQDSKLGALVRFFQPELRTNPAVYAGARTPPILPGQSGPPPSIAPQSIEGPSGFEKYALPGLYGAGAGAAVAPGPTRGLAAPGFGQQFFTGLGAGLNSGLTRKAQALALTEKQQDIADRALRTKIAQQQADIAVQGEKRAQEEHQRKMKLFDAQQKFFGGDEGAPGMTAPQSSLLSIPAPQVEQSGTLPTGGNLVGTQSETLGPSGLAPQPVPSPNSYAALVSDLGITNSDEQATLAAARAADMGSGNLNHTLQAVNSIRTQRAISGRQQETFKNQAENAGAIKPTPEALAEGGTPPDFHDYPLGKKDPGYKTAVQKYVDAGVKRKQKGANETAAIRATMINQTRPIQAYDPNTETNIVTNFEKGVPGQPKGAPILAASQSGATNVAGKRATVMELDKNITNVQDTIKTLDSADTVQKAAMASTLTPSATKHGQVIEGIARNQLTQPQRDLVDTIRNLRQGASSLRNILSTAGVTDHRVLTLESELPNEQDIMGSSAAMKTKLDRFVGIYNEIKAAYPDLITEDRKANHKAGGAKPPAGAKVIKLEDFLKQ